MRKLIAKLEQMAKDYKADTLVSMTEGYCNERIADLLLDLAKKIEEGEFDDHPKPRPLPIQKPSDFKQTHFIGECQTIHFPVGRMTVTYRWNGETWVKISTTYNYPDERLRW